MTDAAEDSVPVEVLAAWGFAGATVRAFERGLINKHWLASKGEARLVLRRYNPARSPEAVAWEQAMVGFARSRGWPTATPIPTNDGHLTFEHGGRLWAAAPFLPGTPTMQPMPDDFRRQGELLARLHRDIADFEQHAQRPGFGMSTDLDTWVSQSGACTFDEAVAAFEQEHRELATLIRDRRRANAEELHAGGYDELSPSPVHGDFEDFNLLWSGTQLTGLLDFDFSRRDVPVADLAVMLAPFMPLDRASARALVGGYESVRPLSDIESNLLVPLTRAKLLWWVSLLLAAWRRNGGEPPGGIARTMMVRWPALDAAESGWLEAWRR